MWNYQTETQIVASPQGRRRSPLAGRTDGRREWDQQQQEGEAQWQGGQEQAAPRRWEQPPAASRCPGRHRGCSGGAPCQGPLATGRSPHHRQRHRLPPPSPDRWTLCAWERALPPNSHPALPRLAAARAPRRENALAIPVRLKSPPPTACFPARRVSLNIVRAARCSPCPLHAGEGASVSAASAELGGPGGRGAGGPERTRVASGCLAPRPTHRPCPKPGAHMLSGGPSRSPPL